MDSISNTQDIIDSRDVIERIAELEAEGAEQDTDEGDEYEMLKELDDDGRNDFGEEWKYGVILIHEDYFVEYAKQLAEDVGAIDREAAWPACHIDWDAAADSLKMDYSEVSVGGEWYWGRN